MMDTETTSSAPNRVVVGMSGGVDSALAAALLRERGYDVVGVTLRTWRMPSDAAAPAPSALDHAVACAEALGVPLRVLDVRERFYRAVVAPFVAAYAAARTPNPCVVCNPRLKFAALLEEADRLGARWIATGHYARVSHPAEGPARLLQARSEQKDQSYMLYRLTQRHLRRLLLPLGEIADKATVRERARRLGLPAAEAQDSQDLCFMRGGDYRELLARARPEAIRPGPIYDVTGAEVGRHRGLPYYTVGQRSGLGIAGPQRLYVLRLLPERNALVVGPRPALERRSCELEAVTWIAGAPPAEDFEAQGRVRYRAPLVPVTVHVRGVGRARVDFARAQVRIAPGQSLVLYDGPLVLGGGVFLPQSSSTV
jgi:tRNA-specific 2-thiouridylase